MRRASSTAWVGVLFVGVAAGSASAAIVLPGGGVSLQTVLDEPDQTFVIGDKDFTVTAFASTTYNAADITIVPVNLGLAGIGFDLLGNFQDTPGDGVPSGFQFQYEVSINTPGFFIVDNRLQFNGFAAGAGSSATVNETVIDPNGGALVGNKLVFADGGVPSSDWVLEDLLNFSPRTSVQVTKDIQFFANGSAGIAQASFVRQTFSQIPTPGAGAALALGLAACLRRRR